MSERTKLRGRGQLTLPSAVRRQAGVGEGDLFEVEVVPDGILLRPQRVVPADQVWFWSERWQAMEREADEDVAAGRVERFDSAEDLFDDLDDG